MLTCFVQEEKLEWDLLLPYMLFAYTEVPQDSTGFSPFELLYGRHVRGPLSIIRETWEEPKGHTRSDSVISYILKTREALVKMSDIAHMLESISKKKQKVYYDRNACKRTLQPGQKVSILLPTVSNKLFAEWKGPFEVVEKVSPVDYSIQLGKRSKKVFHVNMLKEWISREEEKADDSKHSINAVVDTEQPVPSLYIGITENEDIETDNITNPLLVPQEGIGNVVINETLEVSKKGELRALLETFEDVLTDVPGKTNLLQHDVKLNSDVPVSKKAYSLPYAVRDKVKKEIQDMVEAGIAEKSITPYAAPIVIVPKKDNTIRLCVDYRQLNKVTIFDPQPMPKLEDIIN